MPDDLSYELSTLLRVEQCSKISLRKWKSAIKLPDPSKEFIFGNKGHSTLLLVNIVMSDNDGNSKFGAFFRFYYYLAHACLHAFALKSLLLLHIRSDAADEVRMLFEHFFCLKSIMISLWLYSWDKKNGQKAFSPHLQHLTYIHRKKQQ